MPDSCIPTKPGNYPSDCEITAGLRTMAANRPKQTMEKDKKLALSKAKHVKLLLLDVDGVLTDGTLIYTHDGKESKMFNTQDGFGLRLIGEAGIDTGVITARKSDVVARRATELSMRYIYQGSGNKLDAYKEIMKQSGLKPFEIGYMGDDWLDLALLNRVGFAAVPANAVSEVKEIAHYVTNQPGGHGAVREVCDLLLESRNMLTTCLQDYMNR